MTKYYSDEESELFGDTVVACVDVIIDAYKKVVDSGFDIGKMEFGCVVSKELFECFKEVNGELKEKKNDIQ